MRVDGGGRDGLPRMGIRTFSLSILGDGRWPRAEAQPLVPAGAAGTIRSTRIHPNAAGVKVMALQGTHRCNGTPRGGGRAPLRSMGLKWKRGSPTSESPRWWEMHRKRSKNSTFPASSGVVHGVRMGARPGSPGGCSHSPQPAVGPGPGSSRCVLHS